MSMSPDTLTTLIVIVVCLAVLGMRLSFESWQFNRNRMRVLATFISERATDPYNARRLEEMGLRFTPFRIGLRDYRSEAIGALLHNGFIQRTADGRVYLSQEACQFYIATREK